MEVGGGNIKVYGRGRSTSNTSTSAGDRKEPAGGTMGKAERETWPTHPHTVRADMMATQRSVRNLNHSPLDREKQTTGRELGEQGTEISRWSAASGVLGRGVLAFLGGKQPKWCPWRPLNDGLA